MIDPDLTPGTQRARRGHDFLPRAAELDAIPPLYGTEPVELADKVLHLHYFSGAGDWWIAEMDQTTGECFALVDLGLGFREWGYVSLVELERIAPAVSVNHPAAGGTVRMSWLVERDCYWTKVRAADLA